MGCCWGQLLGPCWKVSDLARKAQLRHAQFQPPASKITEVSVGTRCGSALNQQKVRLAENHCAWAAGIGEKFALVQKAIGGYEAKANPAALGRALVRVALNERCRRHGRVVR